MLDAILTTLIVIGAIVAVLVLIGIVQLAILWVTGLPDGDPLWVRWRS